MQVREYILGEKRNRALGWLIILLGVIVSIAFSIHTANKDLDEDKLRFEYEVDQLAKSIGFRVEQYEAILNQARAFFLSSDFVSKVEFQNYVKETEILAKYPGIRGLGFAIKVSKENRKQFLSSVKKEFNEFEIWPSGERETYFPNLFFEPVSNRNFFAVGYDMFSDPIRQSAMKIAWESGEASVSRRLNLLAGKSFGSDSGVIFYLPLYTDGVVPYLGSERQKKLRGFIFAPIETDKLFSSVISGNIDGVEVRVYDGKNMNRANLLYELDTIFPMAKGFPGSLSTRRDIKFHNTVFSLEFSTLENFKRKFSYSSTVFVAMLGVLFTLLIFQIYRMTSEQMEISRLSEKALAESVRARDEFFSIASHEFKTPLTSLKLQTQLFKRAIQKQDTKPLTNDFLNSVVKVLDGQINRMERLVDDMLDVSRIRTGKLAIKKEEFELCDLVKDVVERMKAQFAEIPDGQPSLSFCNDSKGNWDRFRIEQIVTNLLSNAIKYGEKKNIEIVISSSLNSVLLKVKDHGMGIPEEFKDKIFNRFERAGVSPREIAGLGLGLFITKVLVEAHCGKIWFDSHKGVGTTFFVELPRRA